MQVELLQEEIAKLEELMLAKRPEMGEALARIHQTLQTYPENVTLLKPEEVGIVIRSLTEVSQIELVKRAVSSSKGTKALKAQLGGL